MTPEQLEANRHCPLGGGRKDCPCEGNCNHRVIGTIDLTPTWEQQARTCIVLLTDAKQGSKAYEAAKTEVIRMGRMIDMHIHNAGAKVKP